MLTRRNVLDFLAALPLFSLWVSKKAEAPVYQIRPEDLKPRFRVLDRPPYSPGTHTDFAQMLLDIRQHVVANPGSRVVPCDEPKRGQIGYMVGGPHEYHRFSISIRDLKGHVAGHDFNEDPEDVLQLAKMLEGDGIPETGVV